MVEREETVFFFCDSNETSICMSKYRMEACQHKSYALILDSLTLEQFDSRIVWLEESLPFGEFDLWRV